MYVSNADNCSDFEQAHLNYPSVNSSVIGQYDGNISLQSEPNDDPSSRIPVIVNIFKRRRQQTIKRKPVQKTIRRNNLILQAIELPTVMNLNPRSIYNKSEEFPVLLEQYNADVV